MDMVLAELAFVLMMAAQVLAVIVVQSAPIRDERGRPGGRKTRLDSLTKTANSEASIHAPARLPA